MKEEQFVDQCNDMWQSYVHYVADHGSTVNPIKNDKKKVSMSYLSGGTFFSMAQSHDVRDRIEQRVVTSITASPHPVPPPLKITLDIHTDPVDDNTFIVASLSRPPTVDEIRRVCPDITFSKNIISCVSIYVRFVGNGIMISARNKRDVDYISLGVCHYIPTGKREFGYHATSSSAACDMNIILDGTLYDNCDDLTKGSSSTKMMCSLRHNGVLIRSVVVLERCNAYYTEEVLLTALYSLKNLPKNIVREHIIPQMCFFVDFC